MTDAERAQQITGCQHEWYAGIAFCSAHDEDGNPMWDQCRWVPVYQALREARRRALNEAADWFDLDVDESGPSYHVDDPAGGGRLAYYEAGPWAAAHLRQRADSW